MTPALRLAGVMCFGIVIVLSGCVRLAKSTQTALGTLAAEREAAVYYANLVKSAGVTPEEAKKLSSAYDDAAVSANRSIAQFKLAVNQAVDFVETDPTDTLALSAGAQLRKFREQAKAATESIRPALDPVEDIMTAAYEWWSSENKRRRDAFIEHAQSLHMDMWPEIKP